MAATTSDNVEEEDWFLNINNSNTKKLMIKSNDNSNQNHYEQQGAKSQHKPQLHVIRKKSGQADTYLYHCRKSLRVPSCGSNSSNDNDNDNNNNNKHRNNNNGDCHYRKASTTTIKTNENENQNQKEQDQVQTKMRLLVINNNDDENDNNVKSSHERVDIQTARRGRAIQVSNSNSTSSNLFVKPKLTSESVCELNQKYHYESMCNRLGGQAVLATKKCQALNIEMSNMISSDVKVLKNRKLFLRKRLDTRGDGESDGENDYLVKRKKKRREIEYFNSVVKEEEEKEQLGEGITTTATTATTTTRKGEEKSLRERRRNNKRRRPEVESVRLINSLNSNSINKGPIKMWRQLVVLSFLSIMLTTLLANLNIIPQMSTSSCLLFNQCHALSVHQQQQQQQQSSSNSIAAPGTKITPILSSSSSSSSTADSVSTTSTSVTPPTIISSTTSTTPITTTTSLNLQKNTFVPTQRPRYSPTNPTTPNSSGASINAPTIPPVSTTQSSNVAVAFVPASSQRLTPSAVDKKHHSNSSPTSLWSNNLKPTTEQQQLHKQHKYQQQQQQQLAKQQQLTQLTGTAAANSNKTATESLQEFTTIASIEGASINNRQKFTFDENNNNDNNYQNANKKSSKSNDINNNGNFQASARMPMSMKDNSEASSSSVVSSITRESHVEPQMTSLSGSSNLLKASSSSLDEPIPAIVVGRRAKQQQQQQHKHSPLTTTKVPTSTSSSSSAIKLIASPTLHVSESSLSSSTTPSPSHQLNSSSSYSSSFPFSSPRDNQFQFPKQRQQQPTSTTKLFQSIGDGWSISSDGIDSTAAPNSLVLNDTSIRYNPGLPPADLYKAADSTGRASVLPSGGNSGGTTKFSSPPASPRQADGVVQQAGHHQFLVPAGGLSMPQNLFQSMIHSALSDLMNNEQLFGSASATGSRPIVLRSRLHPVTIQPTTNQNQQQPVMNNRRFQFYSNNNQASKQSMAASASAPSISLPPLSHFLVPRNPFRLFSSSSTTNPIITRYRPSFISNKLKTASGNNKQATSIGNDQQQQQTNNRWSNIGPHHYASAVASNSFPRTPPLAFQGSATLAGLDDNTNTNLYAHSHSAEQLERLVRAASQATGINSPILPAIVSAPSGAFPGYYIPAIESESESQVNEFRHGEMAGSSSISSKIPGTDYVLHPDEVRAMINIGEIAWRQQQQNEQASSSNSKSNHNQQQGQDSSISEIRDWQFGSRNPSSGGGAAGGGYMQENHAENARDFAYVDPQNRRDQMQAHSSSNNNNYNDHHHGHRHYQHQHQHQTRQAPNSSLNSSELESHLLKHFHQKQLNSFPAIIRVNDQDYIHWPLIKMNNQNQNHNQHHQQNHETQLNQQQTTNTEQHLNHPHHNFDGSKFSASSSIVHPFQISGPPLSPFQRQNQFITLASQINNQYRPSGQLLQIPLAAAINTLSNHPFPQQVNMAPHHHLDQQENHNHAGWAPSASIITPSVISNPKTVAPGGATLHPLDNLDQSPVRLATQLTPQEVRQVEDSIIEALIMNQSLQHQRKIMEGLVANQNQLRPAFMSPNQPIMSNSPSSSESNQKSQGSVIKNGFFSRRRRHNSNNSNNNNNNNNNNNSKNQKDNVENNQEKMKQLLLAASASAVTPQLIGPIPLVNISALPIHIISPILPPYTDLSLPEHAIVGPAFIQPQESLVLESRLASKQRIPILLADQETNRGNLVVSRPIDSFEKLSVDSSAPKASISNPPSASDKMSSDILSFADSERTPRHSTTGGEAAFGSRVSRIKSSPSLTSGSITSGSPMPWDKSPSLSSSTIVKSHEMKSSLTRDGNEPFFTDGGNKSKQQILSFSPINPSTSRPYRHVDWPTMVSDADYFPDRDNNNNNNNNEIITNNNYAAQHSPHQQQMSAESKNVNQRDKQQRGSSISSNSFSNSQGDDNLHLSSSHVIRPSQSTTLDHDNKQQKYITSQLKLQFAQDYQAREGVPIYNNNVRIAGALDRQRSSSSTSPLMLEGGQSSHNIPNRFTTSSQRVPSEIESSNDDDSGSNDDSDEADDDSPERDLQQKGSSDKKISTLIVAQPTTSSSSSSPSTTTTTTTTTIKPEIVKLSSTTSVAINNKLNKQNTSRYERRPNSRGPQIGQSQLFD